MVEPPERLRAAQFPALVSILAVFLLSLSGDVAAQVPVTHSFNPIESHAARTQLRRAAEQAAQQQWAETLDLYQQVITDFRDVMARVPKDDPMADPTESFLLYVDARQHAQARIASLPPEALALYRSRVDAQAERLFRQGKVNRDRVMLRRVIDEMFASSWGDSALEALGDLAFQDGQFGEALGYYRRLVPDPRMGAIGTNYPDSDLDLAKIAAKALLARAALGTDPPTAADLRAFAASYPDATGSLTGREGLLSQTLAAAIAEDHLSLPLQADGRWPTFAGAGSRSRIAPGPIDIGQFQWKIKLESPPPPRPNQGMQPMRGGGFGMPSPLPPAVAPDVQLAYHPIVLGDEVVICDEGRIHSYRLSERPSLGEGDDAQVASISKGKKKPLWDSPLPGVFASPISRATGAGAPRFTLTASADRIYARLGGSGRTGAALVALRNNREVEGKRIWQKNANEIPLPRSRPDAPNRFTALFEGSPVADSRSVYIALSEGSNGQMAAYIASLDAETGAVRWVKALGSGTVENGALNNFNGGMGGGFVGPNPTSDIGNRLLSIEGQTIYYQTNLGALAALDAETGSVRWLAAYPTRERSSPAPQRESNPAVVQDGLVMIAPDDALPIYAFDASTGRLAWQTAPMEKVSHVLGVAKGRLIATGDRVYSFDLKDGKLKAAWPDGASSFEACGRGLLAGDSIYWPTKSDIYVLDQATGTPTDREPIRLMQHYGTGGGNLAVGDGYLIIAQKDWLVVFAQNSRLMDSIRQEIAAHPDRAIPYFQLAKIAEATGQDSMALAAFEDARTRAKPADMVDGQPLIDEALAKQYRLLLRLATKAKETKNWSEEVKHLEAAVRVARNDRDRLSARLSLASAQTLSGDPKSAVVTYQDILADESLRSRTVPGDIDERWTVRADLLIADQLESLLKSGGRSLYSTYDAKAQALFEQGRKEKSPRLLEEVARAYPAAKVAPESLLALGMLLEEKQQTAEATRAYRKLATSSSSDALRVKAMLGLARVYESQGLLLSARETLTRIQANYSDLRLDDLPPGLGTVGSFVAERLTRGPFDKIGGNRAEMAVPLPLSRVWERSWPSAVKPIAAQGVPPSATSGRIVLAERTVIRPIDPASGDSAWNFELGEDPLWIGYLSDRLLVATASKIVALDPTKGKVRWTFPEDPSKTKKSVANPFAPIAAPRNPDQVASSARFHDFQVSGNRVYFLKGDREMIALDGDNGGIEWTFTPPQGTINTHWLVDLKRVVLQVETMPTQALVVLDATTGRRRLFPKESKTADEATKPWSRPPLPIDEDHVCVTLDPRTVALVDLSTGTRVWTSKVASDALPRFGPPRLLGDASRLLVIYEGNELIRIDASTGRRLWARSLGLEDLSDAPDALALDGDRLYCVTGATLASYKLSDGTPLWTKALTGPKTGWSLALTDRYVATYPSPAHSDDGPIEGLPLVVCRRDDGALVQRLAFPATVRELSISFLPKGALVATQGGVWALGPSKQR